MLTLLALTLPIWISRLIILTLVSLRLFLEIFPRSKWDHRLAYPGKATKSSCNPREAFAKFALSFTFSTWSSWKYALSLNGWLLLRSRRATIRNCVFRKVIYSSAVRFFDSLNIHSWSSNLCLRLLMQGYWNPGDNRHKKNKPNQPSTCYSPANAERIPLLPSSSL